MPPPWATACHTPSASRPIPKPASRYSPARPPSPQIPIYDFKQSRRSGYVTLEVPPSRIVIIEGIYALSERLRPLLDLKVSITGGQANGREGGETSPQGHAARACVQGGART